MLGQAMTELLICASFILVPLFLIVPMFGKFIDMKHTAIQAARYEAWEYTVWYADDCNRTAISAIGGGPEECPMGGFEAHNKQPFKSIDETKIESRQRFFGTRTVRGSDDLGNITLTGTPITKDDKDSFASVDPNFSWYDHTGLAMYNRGSITSGLVSSQDTPGLPIIDTVFDVLLGVLNVVFSAVGDLLGVLGSSVGFDAINSDGYATSTVSVPVTSVPVYRSLGQAIGQVGAQPATPIIFSSNAGVLTDGWNAGGREQTYNQAAGAVPTSLLKALFDLPGLSVVWDAIGVLAPELRRCGQPNYLQNPFDLETPHWADDKGSLWFGHIDSEAVHRDRLDDGTETHSCDDAGRCDFDDTYTRERDCIE
ncbi:MAG: hypothetical protein ACI9BW_003356 [Gammaproteobacteria bacterium]|jgi:hypothetical protein